LSEEWFVANHGSVCACSRGHCLAGGFSPTGVGGGAGGRASVCGAELAAGTRKLRDAFTLSLSKYPSTIGQTASKAAAM